MCTLIHLRLSKKILQSFRYVLRDYPAGSCVYLFGMQWAGTGDVVSWQLAEEKYRDCDSAEERLDREKVEWSRERGSKASAKKTSELLYKGSNNWIFFYINAKFFFNFFRLLFATAYMCLYVFKDICLSPKWTQRIWQERWQLQLAANYWIWMKMRVFSIYICMFVLHMYLLYICICVHLLCGRSEMGWTAWALPEDRLKAVASLVSQLSLNDSWKHVCVCVCIIAPEWQVRHRYIWADVYMYIHMWW